MKHPISEAKLVSGRLRVARRDFEAAHPPEEISWSEIGRRVWKRLGKAKLDTSKLGRIKNGQKEPSLAELRAFAAVLEVDLGWLAFGHYEPGHIPVMPEQEPATREGSKLKVMREATPLARGGGHSKGGAR